MKYGSISEALGVACATKGLRSKSPPVQAYSYALLPCPPNGSTSPVAGTAELRPDVLESQSTHLLAAVGEGYS